MKIELTPGYASSSQRKSMNRREKIEAMLAEDPKDTFLRYSLAMEMRAEGDHEGSLAQLSELMGEKPACVPAFFMAGPASSAYFASLV